MTPRRRTVTAAQIAVRLLLGGVAAPAHADDEDALRLADQAPVVERRQHDLNLQFELAAGLRTLDGSAYRDANRASLDLLWDTRPAAHWRAVLAGRLDWTADDAFGQSRAVNTLKEAYLSREIGTHSIADLGRINTHYGVAIGYNPTDFLGVGTVRTVLSADPDSLRKNRLGNAMLRWQTLWSGGSLTAIWSPKLAGRPNENGASLDWGASNPKRRLMLAVSQRFSENFNPQLLLMHEQGGTPQLGLNLSRVFGNSTVGYVEWAGGVTQRDWQQDRQREAAPHAKPAARRWANRVAAGATWTSASRLSVTLEFHYNGAAPDASAWRVLRARPWYRGYLANALRDGNLAPRRGAMLYVYWKNAFNQPVDLTAMHLRDLVDYSGISWIEARYHWARTDLALQWQHTHGASNSHYGMATARQMIRVVAARYF